jgi:hypothetical protein
MTDAEGYYQFDGIGRVRTVYINIHAAGFSALVEPVAWMINYGESINIVDFRLLP